MQSSFCNMYPPLTFILSPGRGNLCNLCICNLYVNLNLCWCAHDVQLLAQISSCSGRGAWTRSRTILPVKIHLAGQVFQRFLLGHGYMEHRANMRVTLVWKERRLRLLHPVVGRRPPSPLRACNFVHLLNVLRNAPPNACNALSQYGQQYFEARTCTLNAPARAP